jgi:hypothetical protein
MERVFRQLNEIEEEHHDFFEKSGKSILEYITCGLFSFGAFYNSDLPPEIVRKIRKIFDNTDFFDTTSVQGKQIKIPGNAQLHETPISTHWLDESGILCTISKKVERTVEHYEKVMGLYRKLTKDNNKLCLLADSTNSMPMTHEVNKFVAAEMPKYIKAHAIISPLQLDGTQIQTFIKLSNIGFPVMKFHDEDKAKEWLKKYL